MSLKVAIFFYSQNTSLTNNYSKSYIIIPLRARLVKPFLYGAFSLFPDALRLCLRTKGLFFVGSLQILFLFFINFSQCTGFVACRNVTKTSGIFRQFFSRDLFDNDLTCNQLPVHRNVFFKVQLLRLAQYKSHNIPPGVNL